MLKYLEQSTEKITLINCYLFLISQCINRCMYWYWSNKRMEGKITKNEICVISHSNKVPYRIMWGVGHL